MSEFKGTQNWRIREVEDFFFIEADLPNAEGNGHYPRVEVMQEDFGDHNGYTEKLRRSDAQLISKAPEMLEFLIELENDREVFSDLFPSQQERLLQLIKEATTI